MKIKRRTMIWIFLVLPFFYPSSIEGTVFSTIWYRWKLCAVFCGSIYILLRIKKLKYLEKSTWFIILMYVMQIISSLINKLDIGRSRRLTRMLRLRSQLQSRRYLQSITSLGRTWESVWSRAAVTPFRQLHLQQLI